LVDSSISSGSDSRRNNASSTVSSGLRRMRSNWCWAVNSPRRGVCRELEDGL
jgi:hypothetical protein